MVYVSFAFLLGFAVLVLLLKRDSAQVWVQTSAPIENWLNIISSDTGQFLAAVVAYDVGGIYTSLDYGSTWTLTSAPIENWRGITSDSTGQFLAAVVDGGGIYTSSNYGSTWNLTTAPTSKAWIGIASNHTGQFLAATVGGCCVTGGIYTSFNYGSTWTLTSAPTEYWYAITSSITGQFLAATNFPGGIYISSDYGSTWKKTSAPSEYWPYIISSTTGQFLAAIVYYGGGIYTSSNYGSTWTMTSAPIKYWSGIASNSTGQFLAAVVGGYEGEAGGIYTSSNYGSTWTLTSAPTELWNRITCSSSGQFLAATVVPGGIWTFNYDSDTPQPSPAPAIIPSALPTAIPLTVLSSSPSTLPTCILSPSPSAFPTNRPTAYPTTSATFVSSSLPSIGPTAIPTTSAISAPTPAPSSAPTAIPTTSAISAPSPAPSSAPTAVGTSSAISAPSPVPSSAPTAIGTTSAISAPSPVPSSVPTAIGTISATPVPSPAPSSAPTGFNESFPTPAPTTIATPSTIILPTVSTPATQSPSSYPPLSNETPMPSTASNVQAAVDISVSVELTGGLNALILSVGIVFFISGLAAVIYGRRGHRKDELNELGSPNVESLDLLLRGANIVFSFVVIAASARRPPDAFLGLLITSKVLVALSWGVFCLKLLKVDDWKAVSLLYASLQQQYIGGNASSRDKALYRLLLVLALLDLNMLRLLPWKRTRITGALNGFPDAFTLRLVLYCSCTAYLIAAVASIVGVTLGDSSTGLDPGTAIAFAVLSILNTLSMLISTALYLMSAKFTDAKLVLVDEAQLSHTIAAPSPTTAAPDVDTDVGLNVEEVTVNPLVSVVAICSNEVAEKEVDGLEEHPDKGGGNADDIAHADEDEIDPYANRTMDMLKAQVRAAGKIPLQFIPLAKLKADVASLMRAAMAGEPHDEARLEYLSYCLDSNPEYQAELAEESRRWREQMFPYFAQCLAEQRKFIPSVIFDATKQELVSLGLKPVLAGRFNQRPALRLVRMGEGYIGKMHGADLATKYNPVGQGLDIVELAAIFAVLPLKFANDPQGKKAQTHASLEAKLKQMLARKEQGTLEASLLRHPAYRNQQPLFAHDLALRQDDIVSSEGAFGPRTSFRRLSTKTTTAITPESTKAPAPAAAPSVKAATTISIRGGGAAGAGGRIAASGASADIVAIAAVTGTPQASASKAVTRATAGESSSSSSSKPITTGVMQQMVQQLSQALGRRSSAVTSPPPAAPRRSDGGSTAGSDLFGIADLPPSSFSTARSASVTDLPRSLSHNDDF